MQVKIHTVSRLGHDQPTWLDERLSPPWPLSRPTASPTLCRVWSRLLITRSKLRASWCSRCRLAPLPR